MAVDARIEVTLPPQPARWLAGRPGSTWVELVVEFVRHRTLGALGAVVILLMILILIALLAGIIAPHDPLETSFLDQLKPPSPEYLLGTDTFGRDVLSRLIYGSRTALKIGFGAAVVGASIGALLGVTSAYFGGKIDMLLERLMDVLISFPLHRRNTRADRAAAHAAERDGAIPDSGDRLSGPGDALGSRAELPRTGRL